MKLKMIKWRPTSFMSAVFGLATFWSGWMTLRRHGFNSLVPRLPSTLSSWLYTWPLNRPEKWEKAWYNSYMFKPQGGVDHAVMWTLFQ